MLGFDTGLDEFILNIDGMFDVDAEDDRLSVFAMLGPITDDIADEIGTINTGG